MNSSCKKSAEYFYILQKAKEPVGLCLSEYREPDIKARVIGIKTQMKNFDLFFWYTFRPFST